MTTRRPAATSKASAPPARSEAAAIADRLLLDRFAPAAVLVDANGAAIHCRGPTETFLAQPAGAPTANLLELARPGLRGALAAALGETAASRTTTVAHDAVLPLGDRFLPVRITVTPWTGEGGSFFLVVFEHADTAAAVGNDLLARRLAEELRATQSDLQATIVRLRDENAERERQLADHAIALRAARKRLAGTRALMGRVRELEGAQRDAEELLANCDVASLWLDSELRVRRVSPAAAAAIHLYPGDAGRPIGDFSAAHVGPDLAAVAAAALAGRGPQQTTFRNAAGRVLIRRVLPASKGDGTPAGVAATYADVTDSDFAAEAADLARRELSELHERRMRERTDRLRALSGALALAEERERRALAQDLHDDLGQLIAVIKLKIGAMRKLKLSGMQRQALDDVSGAVDNAHRKLRSMSFRLSPPMLYEAGLIPALEWLGEEMREVYGLAVRTEDDGIDKPLDPVVSATVFRAVRELLINVAKHARVGSATITTASSEGRTLVVDVSDAGSGFDPDSLPVHNGTPGFGLLSIRERLGFLGGEVTIVSHPGDGTSVILRAPLLQNASVHRQVQGEIRT